MPEEYLQSPVEKVSCKSEILNRANQSKASEESDGHIKEML